MEEEKVNEPASEPIVETKKSFGPILVVVIVLIVVVLVAVKVFMGGKSFGSSQSPLPTQGAIRKDSDLEKLDVPDGTIINQMTVIGKNYAFEPNEIKVKKGQALSVSFLSKESVHDFVIDEYDVKTKQLPDGQGQTVSFLADKAGTFEFYCSIGNHKAMGLVGKLIVEE